MFVRAKKSGKYKYLQRVHNERVDGHIRQQVLATLGRLQQSGQIACARFAEQIAVLEAHRRGQTEVAEAIKIGPPLLVERLWRELELGERLEGMLANHSGSTAEARATDPTCPVIHASPY